MKPSSETTAPIADGRHTFCRRMIFKSEETSARLMSQQVIKMVAMPSAPLGDWKNTAGSWFELRNKENHLLYRRVLHSFHSKYVEVRLEKSDFSYELEESSISDRSFCLLIPEIAASAFLVLFGNQDEETPEPARELFRFDLSAVNGNGVTES